MLVSPTPAENPTDPILACDQETAFVVDDVVALAMAWPEGDLSPGDWGTVLAVAHDGWCDVEFTDREGNPKLTTKVPSGALELLWSEDE